MLFPGFKKFKSFSEGDSAAFPPLIDTVPTLDVIIYYLQIFKWKYAYGHIVTVVTICCYFQASSSPLKFRQIVPATRWKTSSWSLRKTQRQRRRWRLCSLRCRSSHWVFQCLVMMTSECNDTNEFSIYFMDHANMCYMWGMWDFVFVCKFLPAQRYC